ncbi:Na+ driven multidrug efflux pump [hydrothermal vent metagenome]|uniref:Multidrug-efflux transporter n=1 Tax=hydrothermal vent metagenome TaxID=652676 RepID=A0A1W1EHN3_9ZZZZ
MKKINIKKHKKILSIALPSAINSLLDMLQVITDLLMVGRISAFAIAAVGLGLQSLMFVFAVLTLFHIGTTALISRFIGAKQYKRASMSLASLLQFAFLLSIPISLLWYIFTPQLFVWFGTADEVVELGSAYVTVLTIMLPFIFMKLVFVSSFNSFGDTLTPLYIKIFSILLNVGLNYLFIFGHFGFPALGVVGAGVATVIVNILEFSIYMILYISKKTPFTPLWYYSKSLIKRAIKVGIPASIERSLTFGSFMLFTVIIAHYGTETLAGYQLGLRIEGLAFMPGIGFTIAAMTLMGQGLGAKNPTKAKEDVILILKYTTAFMFSLGLIMIFTPQPIVRVFTNDTKTIEEASLYLMIVGFSQIPLAFNFVISGALRGAGDSKRTLKINLISLWFIRIIPAFALSYYFENILFVYLAMISDTTIKAILLWRAFNNGEWQKIKV